MYLAQVTGLSQTEIVACMKRFCDPDPFSRTATEGGARLVLIDEHRDWGWKIVNHAHYRERARKKMQQIEATTCGRDADRKRRDRDRKDSSDVQRSPATPAESSVDQLSDADADADTEKDKDRGQRRQVPSPVPPAFHQEVIAVYHELCPLLARVKIWGPKQRKALNDRIAERMAADKSADTVEYWRSVFKKVAASRFLCGDNERGWKATLRWIVVEANFQKVIEGDYVNSIRTNGKCSSG